MEESLSSREQAVANHFAEGDTYKEVARKLNIAPSTVRNHLASVYRKLDVRNKPELVHALAKQGAGSGDFSKAVEHAHSIQVLKNLDENSPPHWDGATLAVMPFDNIGPPDTDYFCHGVSADIHHNLTKCHDLLVSGRSSCLAAKGLAADATWVSSRLGVNYVVEGSVRQDGGQVRVTAELVEGKTGTVLWSERYDRSVNDILDVEADIAHAVAASLSLQVEAHQFERAQGLSDNELTAYDCRLKGSRLLELNGPENLERARDCFSRALDIDPDSAPAYAGLSMSYGYACDLLFTDDYADSLEKHVRYADEAVRLKETDSRGHYALACGLMLKGDYEKADRHAARGVDLNPSEYHNLCNRGYSLMTLGRIEESIACLNESLRRNPLAPNSCLMALGLIEYISGNFAQCADTLSRMTAPYIQKPATMAAAYSRLGKQGALKDVIEEFNNISKCIPMCPDAGGTLDWGSFWRYAFPYVGGAVYEELIEDIARAGLPV